MDERARFSVHLLACAECWTEVGQARHGRALAESTRTCCPPASRSRRRPRSLILTVGGGTTEPPSLREAVADFTARELPGSQLPEQRAPDLSRLRLQPVGSGGGSYGALEVDGYAYRDPAGRRVVLYLSDRPFPEAPGAERLAGADGPWVARRGDVIVLCARVPHALLVVGQDDDLVRSTAGALGVL